MKKIFSSLLLFLVLFGISVFTITPSAWAVTRKASPTPSPSPSDSPTPSPTPLPTPSDADTTQSLKERIDKVMEKHRQQVMGIMDQVGTKKRGFIGEVQRVTEKTIAVKNTKGSEILTIEPDISITKDGKKVTIDDIAVGDWIIAMGYMNKEEFTLQRLLVSSSTLQPPTYNTYIGTITGLGKTDLDFAPRNSQTPVTITTNKQTQYLDQDGQTLQRKDLQTDIEYLVISYQDNTSQIARAIRLLAAQNTTTNGK